MTVKEFNENFWPQYNKAVSFVNCMEHALQKSDDNARMQMRVIGWDKDTQKFLLDALRRMEDSARDSYRWSMTDWWKENAK